jgi:general nucleoside transport system ATP-binding protein
MIGADALAMKGIVKKFVLLVANNHVDFSAREGEVHALVGENGAGKTTLMNILYGVLTPDSGSIEIGGRRVDIPRPSAAIDLGIGMVHQHFKLVPSFTIAENIVLGREPGSRFVMDAALARKQVKQIATEKLGIDIDPDTAVVDLPVGLQQQVEILKMLYREARILILDEPTAVLTPQETEELFRTIRKLAKDGKTIIFITHKLNEVMKVSDRVTVMRGGRVVDTLETSKTSAVEIAEKMVGRSILFRVKKEPASPGAVILEVKGLKVDSNRGLEAVSGIDMCVRENEIVGLAGVQGNGQDELIEAITGLRTVERGDVLIGGVSLKNASPRKVREYGAAYIPADRTLVGLSVEDSIWENTLLGHHTSDAYGKRGSLDNNKAVQFTQKIIEKFDIRGARPWAPVKSLSGGNQQKVVLARELSFGGRLIIADQPSRGVDIGAIEFIHSQLIAMRDKGCGVFLISSDLDEIFSLADRILVIFKGRIMGELLSTEATVEKVGRLMAGIMLEGEEKIG